MADYNFTSEQKIILRLLYSLAVLLFMLLSAAIIHNSWRYLYRARLGNILVILFYAICALVAFVHIIFYIMLTISPTTSPYIF